MHPVEFYPKGTGIALAVVRQLLQQGVPCRLVRVTQLPVSDAERRELRDDDLHIGLAPHRVARVVRRCDLLLAPSWAVEGFGLPALEAAASGVPLIASDIPAFRDLLGDWPALVRFDDAGAFAAAAGRLLTDRTAWRQLRARGLEVARRFSAKQSAEVLEAAMRWVADGSWRRDLGASGAARDPEKARA
jgi:glycosyltransferase involved in cell wall biosynthesis